MTATHHKLNIVWKVVRFTIAVRPARSVAQMINRSHRRRIAGERSRTHRIVNPRNGQLAGRRCAPVAQQPCCQPSHCMNLQNRN